MKTPSIHGQRGLTLVDIVAAAVVLGVLAAVSLPRYLHQEQDMRLAKIDGLYDSVRAAAQRTYAASLASGNSGSAGLVDTRAGRVSTAYGYPDVGESGIAFAAGLDPTPAPRDNTDGMQIVVRDGTMIISPYGAAVPQRCRITYTPAPRATSVPAIGLTASLPDC